MPPKSRSRNKRNKHTKHKNKNKNKNKHRNRPRPNPKKSTRSSRSHNHKKKAIIDFSKLNHETLLDLKQHYQITQEIEDKEELAAVIYEKFMKQTVNEEKVLKTFLLISKEM
ncbi:histone deacetylase complex subunit sap30l [Anaeramoeba flamelloides]|uniref:Histone deacetylase complex subunit sap30l n=1 Tax=Anaeramoeba flamelloides TaxID=1746091 RepID=A0ABQ8XFI8_9EUKA|nr:histone deacetylase complex subunit sap30l [Anaeramoeba flamelloides]